MENPNKDLDRHQYGQNSAHKVLTHTKYPNSNSISTGSHLKFKILNLDKAVNCYYSHNHAILVFQHNNLPLNLLDKNMKELKVDLTVSVRDEDCYHC